MDIEKTIFRLENRIERIEISIKKMLKTNYLKRIDELLTRIEKYVFSDNFSKKLKDKK